MVYKNSKLLSVWIFIALCKYLDSNGAVGKRWRPDLKLGLWSFQCIFLHYNAFHTYSSTMPPKKHSKKPSKKPSARRNVPHAATAARPAPSAVLDGLDCVDESEESVCSSLDEQTSSEVEESEDHGNDTNQGKQGQDSAEGMLKKRRNNQMMMHLLQFHRSGQSRTSLLWKQRVFTLYQFFLHELNPWSRKG